MDHGAQRRESLGISERSELILFDRAQRRESFGHPHLISIKKN